MTSRTAASRGTERWPRPGRHAPAADFLALGKPRVVLMVVLTTLVGYYLGAGSGTSTGCG